MDVRQDVVDILSGFALFADLSTPELENIVQSFGEVYFAEGERVIRQGLTATGFYVIVEGAATISVGGKERTSLRPGDFFGEISCLLGEPPTADIIAHIAEHNTVKGAPHIREEHLAVFDCAMGDSPIHYMGHVNMMAAVQPFISGAISKTVNMPADTTVEDIADAYTQAWRLGIKALAIYRDGSKTAQALRTDAGESKDQKAGG